MTLMSNLRSELKKSILCSFKNKVSRFWIMVIAQVFVDDAKTWRETVSMLLVVIKVLSKDKWKKRKLLPPPPLPSSRNLAVEKREKNTSIY